MPPDKIGIIITDFDVLAFADPDDARAHKETFRHGLTADLHIVDVVPGTTTADGDGDSRWTIAHVHQTVHELGYEPIDDAAALDVLQRLGNSLAAVQRALLRVADLEEWTFRKKDFKVAAVSDRPNAHTQWSLILIARDGESHTVKVAEPGFAKYPKGSVVHVNIRRYSGEWNWAALSMVHMGPLPNAGRCMAEEAWKDEDGTDDTSSQG